MLISMSETALSKKEILALLRQGSSFWNHWRRNKLGGRISLAHTDLSGFDLREANLTFVSFRNANLSGVNLLGADLYQADLTGTNYSFATMTHDQLQLFQRATERTLTVR